MAGMFSKPDVPEPEPVPEPEDEGASELAAARAAALRDTRARSSLLTAKTGDAMLTERATVQKKVLLGQ